MGAGKWNVGGSQWKPSLWRQHVEQAIEEVHYRMHLLANAKNLLDQGEAAIALNNAVHDLSTWHRGYDEDHGTLPWERERDA